MNVLMVHSFWHPRGGDTTCMFAEVAGLERRGHTIVPFAMRHPMNIPSPWEVRFPTWTDIWHAEGIDLALGVATAIHNPQAARALDSLLEHVAIDVAHIHHLHRHLTPSILDVFRRHHVPIVWTVHDYELICPNGLLFTENAYCTRCQDHRYGEAIRFRCKRGDLAQSAAVAMEKWVHARQGIWDKVDRFLAPSQFLADRLIEFGVPESRVQHLPNGVEETMDQGEHAATLPRVDWLYAGRLSPEKGISDLLAAAALLPDRRLLVLGDGPARIGVRPLPNVQFAGAVSPREVATALRTVRVVAVPSRWPENFPYAVLEAQLAGCAVVATRVGGIPEQIEDGVDGVLVEDGDPAALAGAVGALLDDPERAIRLGGAGQARVRRRNAMAPWLAAMERVFREVGA